MGTTLRSAQPDAVDLVVPLVYSSGPDAFRYVFGEAVPFLRRAFLDGQGWAFVCSKSGNPLSRMNTARW